MARDTSSSGASTPSGASATTRLLLGLAAIDVSMTPIALFFWLAVIEVVDPRVMLTATAIRLLATGTAFVRLLSPIRAALVADAEASDAQLLAADAALQTLDRRMMWIYGGAWLATASLALLLAGLGIPTEIPLGRLELATAIIMAFSLAVVALPLRALIRSLLFEPHRRIAARLLERGLRNERPPASVGAVMRTVTLGIIACTIPSMMMSGAHLYIVGLRTDASTDALRRVQLAALARELGDPSSPDPDIERLAAEGVPATLDSAGERAPHARLGYERTSSTALAAVPLADGSWLLARVPVDEPLGLAIAIVSVVAGFSFGLALLISAALWQAQRELFVELDEATRRSVEVGDISAFARLVPLHDDELGRLASTFNAMVDMLDELRLAAAGVAEGNLDSHLERPGELHDAFRGMLALLRTVVPRIRATAVDVGGAASEIRASMQQQDQVGQTQAQGMVELDATVRQLTLAASTVAKEAASVLADAEQAAAATAATTREIDGLRDHTAGIGGLLEGVREIADRSDLLALNGSLEATRAGEAGRGFALVAVEMRRLAERVTAIISDARARIGAIEAATQSTLAVTARSRELADSTAEAARRIAALGSQQDQATTAVAATVSEVAGAIEAVARASAQTGAAAQGLEAQAAELEQLTRRFEG